MLLYLVTFFQTFFLEKSYLKYGYMKVITSKYDGFLGENKYVVIPDAYHMGDSISMTSFTLTTE